MACRGNPCRRGVGAIFLAVLAAAPAHSATPSFDCAQAESGAEELVCGDTALAELDVELARLFEIARDDPQLSEAERANLIAAQRGWIKGRDDCWKATDEYRCVQGSYAIRIHELRRDSAAVGSANGRDSEGPFNVICDGFDAPMSLGFGGNKAALAILAWKDRFVVLPIARSGSGARYAGGSYDGDYLFWIKGNDARFEMPDGVIYNCRISRPE